MTSNATHSATATPASTSAAFAAFPADDPRALLGRAIAIGSTVITGARPEQLDGPTPCSEFDVRDLLGHLVFVLRRIAAVGRGDSPFSVAAPTDVADDAWLDTWTEAAGAIPTAWADAARLEAMIEMPWATLPGRVVVLTYVNEVTVHSWDLATATGQRPAWDDSVVATALQVMRIGLPEDHRGGEVPFSAPTTVAAGAPLVDQLAAWNGRRV